MHSSNRDVPNYPAQVVNVLLVSSVIFSYMLIFGLKRSLFQWWWALIKGVCTYSMSSAFKGITLTNIPCLPSHMRLEELPALVERHQHQPDLSHYFCLWSRVSVNFGTPSLAASVLCSRHFLFLLSSSRLLCVSRNNVPYLTLRQVRLFCLSGSGGCLLCRDSFFASCFADTSSLHQHSLWTRVRMPVPSVEFPPKFGSTRGSAHRQSKGRNPPHRVKTAHQHAFSDRSIREATRPFGEFIQNRKFSKV